MCHCVNLTQCHDECQALAVAGSAASVLFPVENQPIGRARDGPGMDVCLRAVGILPVPGVVPAGAHVHVQGIIHPGLLKQLDKLAELHRPFRVGDAQPVACRQAKGTELVHVPVGTGRLDPFAPAEHHLLREAGLRMLELEAECLLLGVGTVHEGIPAILPHEEGTGVPFEAGALIILTAAHMVAADAVMIGLRGEIRREGRRAAKDDAAVGLGIGPVEAPELDGIGRRIINHEPEDGRVDLHQADGFRLVVIFCCRVPVAGSA